MALNFCTAALHLSILAVGIKPGDEVITTPMTFCATVSAIIHAGGTPVLADVDPKTMSIDPAKVEKKITARTLKVEKVSQQRIEEVDICVYIEDYQVISTIRHEK